MKRKKLLQLIMALLICAFVFAGCADGADKNDQDVDSERVEDDEESETAKKVEYLLDFKYDGEKYDLGDGVIELVEKATENGMVVRDVRTIRPFMVKDGVLGLASVDRQSMKEISQEKHLECGINIKDKDQITTLTFSTDVTLSSFSTAEGLKWRSKEKKVPDYYVNVGEYDIVMRKPDRAYCALVADGKIFDLSDYIAALPDEMSVDYYKEIVEKKKGLALASSLLPTGIQNVYMTSTNDVALLQKTYVEDEGFKNTHAFMNALSDLYKEYQDGKVKSIGMIGLSFIDERMIACKYMILSEAVEFKANLDKE